MRVDGADVVLKGLLERAIESGDPAAAEGRA
jgi:hypothetical protein